MDNVSCNEIMSIASNDTDPPNDNLLEERGAAKYIKSVAIRDSIQRESQLWHLSLGQISELQLCKDNRNVRGYEKKPINYPFILSSLDKPLMKLFKRLIGNDTKQNTVLTNAQIIDILQKEFDMDIAYIHELEIEIYLNLMKKFLKDWPLWDDFDHAIQKLKNKNDLEGIKSLLQLNYENIKEYLKKMLTSAEPLLNKAIDEVKSAAAENEKVAKSDQKVDSVVLEVNCTRYQLNNFFYRRPHPDMYNTIFNIDSIPKKISMQTFNLASILNWPNIRITINGFLTMRRDSTHVLKHVLVNKKNICELSQPVELKMNVQHKELKRFTQFLTQLVYEKLQLTLDSIEQDDLRKLFFAICTQIAQDMKKFPSKIFMPATYRKTLNKYPYVRYLHSEVSSTQQSLANRYDLQLEETMSPRVFLRVTSINYVKSIPSDGSWLKIECTTCKSFFSGQNMCLLMQHFTDYHHEERDWQCTNCKKMFPMIKLSENGWHHECDTD